MRSDWPARSGNMTAGAGRTITYDFENRPVSVTKSGTTTTFVYDGDGGRVKKIVGSTTTTYIGKLYVCVGTSCAKMIFGGGQRIAIKQVSSGSTSYFHPDHLGSTSVLTNSSGVKEQDLVYYPYGETYTNTGTANVAYKYTGKELDDSTGLYFYEARYYDAVLARFISADTFVPSPTDPQALNRYTYARNNPIIFNDPSGHFFKKAFKKIGKALNSPLGRAIGWVINPTQFMFIDPGTRNYTLPVAAGFAVGWVPVVGPVLAGAASGAVSAALTGEDVGQAAWIGAAAGAAGAVTGGGLNYLTQGEYFYTSVFVGGLAGGATGAGLRGGNTQQTVMAGLIQGSVASMSAYILYQGGSPTAAKEIPQEQKNSSALRVNQTKPVLVSNKAARVGTIALSTDKTLYFDVETTGFVNGEDVVVQLRPGSALESGRGGLTNPNFEFNTPLATLSKSVNSGGIASFEYNLSYFKDNYLQIYIPNFQSGPAPIMTFGAQGNDIFTPCNPCEPLRGYGGPSGL